MCENKDCKCSSLEQRIAELEGQLAKYVSWAIRLRGALGIMMKSPGFNYVGTEEKITVRDIWIETGEL